MSTLARTLIFAGLGLVALGGLVWLVERAGLPLGNLPGDFSWQSESSNMRVYVPLTTMLLVSLLLTLLVNLFGRLFR
jgi:ribose/xylose/arabinose/galactoside ABC-type transport system permease subunit